MKSKKMRAIEIFISFLTSFVITSTGVLIASMVATKGMPEPSGWLLAVLFGLGAGGKDIRSLLKLPPVNGNGKGPTTP